ncbi:MAG: heavy metal transporter [Firmicutes bacterium]|nr:heavy metal transporter [Bacillota bacterium]
MKKVVKINGMTCEHCQKRVQNALDALPGIKAKVNHKKGEAVISADGAWNEDAIRTAVTEAGYEVVSVADKKGFLGL